MYRALVRNHAKLAYNSVAAWLDGTGAAPNEVAAVPGLPENLRLQDRAAQNMKKLRHLNGALSLETIEAKPVFDGGPDQHSRGGREEPCQGAHRGLHDRGQRRDRAVPRGKGLPLHPTRRARSQAVGQARRAVRGAAASSPEKQDSAALDQFLVRERAADQLRFPDLSLVVIKLLGAGEYVAEQPGDAGPEVHFGLAVRDYAHSTAPNRRYADLVAQRLLKAAIPGGASPYGFEELDGSPVISPRERMRPKVERRVGKSAAALLLESRVGERFDGIITGASDKGTWIRIGHPCAEGKIVRGYEGLDVGDRVRVTLLDTDVEERLCRLREGFVARGLPPPRP